MSTILTDDDRKKVFESLPDALEGFMKKWGWLHFAKGIEAAVLAKLAQQEPVAWLESDQSTASWPARDLFFGFSATAYSSRMHFGNKPKGTSNRLTPLYTHPAMQQADRQRVPQAFTDWLCREMPPGTIISDPAWWAPKIASALLAAAPEAPAPRTDLDVTLTRSEVEAIGAFVDEEMSESDEEVVRLMTGGGHSGHGLYAACPDYPEEGAILVKQLPAPEAPAQAEQAAEPVRDEREPSPTAGMSLAQRILHVGGRNNAAGYVEFGSTQAVEALVRHVLRDLPDAPPAQASAVDERAAFEAWALREYATVRREHGELRWDSPSVGAAVEHALSWWQARAALAQKGGAA